MINFWHKNLTEYDDQGAAVMKLPAAAKIQLEGEPQVWVTPKKGDPVLRPWAKECKDQIELMGAAALAIPEPLWKEAKGRPTLTRLEDLKTAIEELKILIAHNVQPIPLEARRKPRRIEITADPSGDRDHSMDD